MKTLQDFFQSSIFCSGTPSNAQKHIATRYSEYAIHCSLKESIANHYVLKPTLNLIYTSYMENFTAAIKSVFEREMRIADALNRTEIAPRIIVNCNGIDEIDGLLKNEYFNQNMGILFHLISIHTKKTVVGKDGCTYEINPTIDGVYQQKHILMTDIQKKIDENTMFKDNLPIILFQVNTISEGINLKSFSATIITTDNEQRAMQQIGRVIRHYTYDNNKEKVLANVYLMNENYEKISQLIYNLKNYDLTEDCFEWGKSLIPDTGSGSDSNGQPGQLIEFKWRDLKNNSPEIITIHDLNNKFSIKECKKIEKEFQADVEKTETLFNNMLNENKFSIEEEDYFFNKYYTNDLFRIDINVCHEFYFELINR